MWLVVLAPVVSQTLYATAATAESGWCGTNPPLTSSPGHPHDPAAELCGYCDLLGHSPVLIGVARLPALTPATAFIPPPRREMAQAPPPPLRSAAPRGPPSAFDDRLC